MKQVQHFSKAVIRTAAFPFSAIVEAFTADSDDWMDRLLANDYFKVALSLASPELLEKVSTMKQMQPTDPDYKKMRQSLLKYLARMSSRSTPFGLFSGVGVIPINQGEQQGELRIQGNELHAKHFRLDMNFSVQLANELAKCAVIRNNTIYYANTSIYQLGDYLRFISYTIFNKSRSYELISVERNPYLDGVLQLVKQGKGKSDLIQWLIAQEIEPEEAIEYIEELIEAQVLVNELEPSTIGLEIELQLLAGLKNIYDRAAILEDRNWLQTVIAYFEEVINRMNALNAAEISYDNYTALVAFMLNENPIVIPNVDAKFLIQCNVAFEMDQEFGLSKAQESMVRKAIQVVNHFQSSKNTDNETNLGRFKEAFQKRYEEKFVPLGEALDVETGIGYGYRQESESVDFSPLIDGIPVKRTKDSKEKLVWDSKIHSFWYAKIQQAAKENATEITITDEDLKQFDEAEMNYAATFVAKTAFFKHEEKDVLLFEFYGGSTASSWYGRFCNSNEALKQLNQRIIDWEEEKGSDDYLIAELNHLPESRLGNVILRNQSRHYQINYLAQYNGEDETTIGIEDLMIGIRQNKICVISKSLQKEVKVFHSNAFNKEMPSNLPIFQFLADLESQEEYAGGAISLGYFHRFTAYTPRVVYKNTILSRASWRIMKKDLESLYKTNDAELVNAFREIREKWKLPDYFVIKESDNELLIYAQNVDCIRILLSTVKRSGSVSLTEFLQASMDSILTDTHGNQYTNEVLINYKLNKTVPVSPKQLGLGNFLTSTVTDSYPPGSEWIYYKIYLGMKVGDKLLQCVLPLLEELKSQGMLDQWFFIRYADPKAHVRLRMKLTDLQYLGEVMTRLTQELNRFRQSYLIDRIQLDTYQRELDRYGYNCMPVFEQLFYADSKMNIQLLNHCEEHGRLNDLWICGLYSMHTLCTIFELTIDEKERFLEWILTSFRAEFNAYSETTKEINQRYNEQKAVIQDLFLRGNTEGFNSFVTIVEERNADIKKLVDEIKMQYPVKSDQYRFLNSVIHMSINRLFRSHQRMYEYLITDFLKRISATMKHTKSASAKEQLVPLNVSEIE